MTTGLGWRLPFALACLAAVSLSLASCARQDGDLARLFDLEGLRNSDKNRLEIDELKKGIARYAAEAERTVSANGSLGVYHELLAARYIEKAMFKEAYESLLAAIDLYPAKLGLYYQAGVAAGYAAKAAEARGPEGAADKARWLAIAESNYRRILADDPRHANALYGLAVLSEFEFDRPAEAESLVRRFLDVRTKDVDGWMLLGRTLYRQGKLEEALSAYEEAIAASRPQRSIGGTPEIKRQAAERNRDRIKEELDAAAKR